MSGLKNWLILIVASLGGSVAFAVLALHRGETINAVWMIVAAISMYVIAYRFYSSFIACKVMELNEHRTTPSERHNDGLDYVPTHKWVLFGHHFAAIAGPGPLVGPVLAAQMGYLPGTLWVLVGVVLIGAVQDSMILFISMRRDGKSLGDIVKTELGLGAGLVAMFGILLIMIILLAVLSLVVVKALAISPWGTFTVAATIPIAIFMGIYMRYLRPGRIAEMSIIGFALLIASIVLGEHVAQSEIWGPIFTIKGESLVFWLVGYGFTASVLPVWFLLAPRDYLSTFLKIGTIVVLALGILWVSPELKMPALSRFIDGSGPVFAGSLFPFLYITIACGAISGFHSLVSSGTTPKMIMRESHVRTLGYGAMLMESFVAIMALIAACLLEPGVYFALNSPEALIGRTVEDASSIISNWGFVVTPEMLTQIANDVGEKSILSRVGGAPTLAVGMAKILSDVIGGRTMMGFWYHFAILFEALFILTTLDAGTRVCRFMIQDTLGTFYKPLSRSDSWSANLIATSLAVGGWGYFLYQGVIDPLGGINTLWPLFGIANQMLAGIALILITTVLIKMKKERFVWVTLLPTLWLLTITMTAGWQKLFDSNPKIGFLSHAGKYSDAFVRGELLFPAKNMEQMGRIIFNDYVDATFCALFMVVVMTMVILALRSAKTALALPEVSTVEVPLQLREESTHA